MPENHSIQESVSVPANGNVPNALVGTRFETAPGTGLMKLLVTGSAIGIKATLFVAGRNPVQKSAVNAGNRFPVEPDDIILKDIDVFEGEKIQLSLENTTAGALTAFFRFEIEEADVVEVEE